MSKKLRKRQVAERYASTIRTIERWTADGRLPKPFYFGKTPLWDLEELEAWDRTRPHRHPVKLIVKIDSGVAA
jgi:predicted DNA-binding transcriptional regulator AlpA